MRDIIKASVAAATLAASLAGTPALAASEVRNATGSGTNQSAACSNAKLNGQRYANPTGRVTGYGQCDCSATVHSADGEPKFWQCSVDTYLRFDD